MLTIQILTERTLEFCSLMWPIITSKEFQSEVGGAVVDSPSQVWVMAYTQSTGTMAGFGAIKVKGKTAKWEYNYVLPTYRSKEAHLDLFRAQKEESLKHEVTCIQITVKEGAEIEALLELGFKEKRVKGSWKVFEWIAS